MSSPGAMQRGARGIHTRRASLAGMRGGTRGHGAKLLSLLLTLALAGTPFASRGVRAEFDALAPRAESAIDGPALSVRTAVATAKQHNPTLKAALLDLESARWNVSGAAARYEPVLEADASGQQTATANVFGGNVRINRVRRGDFGTELRKHLIWGTDLTLRLASNVQMSHFNGTVASTQNTGMGAQLPSYLTGFGVGSFGPLYGLTAKLTLKQPLWRGRGRDVGEASLREARAQRTASEYARDRVASELLRDLLTAYWELWYADSAVGIQRSSRALALKQRDDAAARAATGSLAPSEVLTFETQVATRDEDVLSAQTERERRAEELGRLLGTNEQAPRYGALVDEPAVERAFVRDTVERRALGESAEVHERAAAVALAQVRQRTADDPQKPRLDLDSYVQSQGLGNKSVSDAAEQFVGGDVISAYVGLTYEAPLRDRVRRAEAAKARIATEIAEEQLRQTRQRVLSEVRGALDREAAGQERVRLAEHTSEIATRQLAAEQARYQSGSSTSLAVLEAEDKLRSAQLRLARARADWSESVLVLEHLTGDLLTRYASL